MVVPFGTAWGRLVLLSVLFRHSYVATYKIDLKNSSNFKTKMSLSISTTLENGKNFKNLEKFTVLKIEAFLSPLTTLLYILAIEREREKFTI